MQKKTNPDPYEFNCAVAKKLCTTKRQNTL